MRRLLLAVVMLGLALPAARQAEGGTEISFDFFYDNLGSDGNWVEVADYGYCWQPAVAVSSTSWRPYADGYWAYTDVGWTWVSYEDFGWATYHYGRWIRLRGRGWIWVPGRDWAPAWVSWRTGGDYVGWAPLPPRGGGDVVYDYSPITAQVDVQFDIGPAYYNFIDIRYIGEPVLRERIFAPEHNVTYITNTVNVTNITYTNSTVYNYGPDFDTLSRYSARPIQRLSVQREADANLVAAARSKSLMRVQGDKLLVAAPPQLQKPSKSIAPKVVKEKFAPAPVERGWEPAGDSKKQAELKQKIKAEDPKKVPPPSLKPREEVAQSSVASSPAPASTTPVAGSQRISPPISPSSAPSTESTQPVAPLPRDKGLKKEKPGQNAPEAAPVVPPQVSKPAIPKQKQKVEPAPPPSNRAIQPDNPPKNTMPPQPKGPKRVVPFQQPPAHVAPPAGPPANAPVKPEGSGKGHDKKKPEPAGTPGS
jgi:hypothetical protein